MLRRQVQKELSYQHKTSLMRLIEAKFEDDIETLIHPKRLPSKDVAMALGIDEGTLSKWRKRFGMKKVRVVKPGPKRKI